MHMKTKFRICSAILAICIIATCFMACGVKPFERHTELQLALIAKPYMFADARMDAKTENGLPLPIELDVSSQKSGYSIVIEIKGEKKLVEPLTGQKKFSYYNYELGREYKWYLIDGDGEKIGSEKRFLTSDVAPRNLYVDGVTNCRDLGGWKTTDGKHVRQGMIYRTSKFSDNDTGSPLVTEAGIRTLTRELGIKTELDIRKEGENAGITESVLGSDVQYIFKPMQSGGNYLILNKRVLADVFSVFADETNYPVAFHCSIGTDRTGCIAFLINAMLGVDKDSLYCDYMFSMLGTVGVKRSSTTIDKYLKEIATAGGETIAENAYNYLVKQGVPAETLDLMKRIMIE